MTDPIPPTPETATAAVVSPDSPPPAPEVAPAPPAAEPEIPGDRLQPPAGSTRVIADYGRPRPSFVFLALVSTISLAADVASKSWAEHHLDGVPGSVEIVKDHLTLLLAKNRGGAWGLLQSTSENVRRPFFLLVSVAAIAFIMALYRRLQPKQRALRWGLPLVLGGALGNVFDRIRYGHVIDFIDYQAQWIFRMNKLFGHDNNHWPTFNIADVAICVGVGLMAIDMFASKRGPRPVIYAPQVPPAQSGEPSVDWSASKEDAPAALTPAPAAPAPPVAPPPTE